MRYQIAGLTVEMSVSGRTARQGAAYAVPDGQAPVDMTVTCDPAKVLRINPEFSNLDNAEYMGTGANFAWKLLDFDGFQLHASAVEDGGGAYLFSGPSGLGKSTHTEKWMRLFGASMINDDKPALRRLADGWYAYGTPWSGKQDKSVNRSVPVAAITFLKRGEENRIRPLNPAEALPLLLSQTPLVMPRAQTERLLALVDRLLREVPIWQLTCRNDDEAALLAREYMTRGKG